MTAEAAEDDTSTELALWLSIVRQANVIHASFPGSLRAEIEAGSSPREITLLATSLARMSTDTRRQIEDTLLDLLDQPPVNRREGPFGLLRLVADP